MRSKKSILEEIEMDFLVQFALDTNLLKPKAYITKKDFVLGLSNRLSIEECFFVVELYKKDANPRKAAKLFLLEKNPTSEVVANRLIKQWALQRYAKIRDNIFFKEFSVSGYRTDVCLVNGYSYAFEIKTARDKIERAAMQTEAFLNAFEYVYLVTTPDKMLPETIDKRVGLILLEHEDGEIVFDLNEKAERNEQFKSLIQLQTLRKDELVELHGNAEDDKRKDELIKEIFETETEKNINRMFKRTIKERFRPQWYNYLKILLK